ncbi:MAG TPA: hypothetical protein VMM84_12120 [Pyrinomonadaceae bacterium]|nr:hypothetical protein [Pyrinomonadaceae bacterium]
MRVFCPEHHRGFFAPRQSPIKCENRGHILGELDFAGESKRPLEIGWQYCCNCEHFCPAELETEGIPRCSVCARQSSVMYLCDRCYTLSFESRTAVQTKNFALSSEGRPEPSCPGCLHEAPVDLYEHSCDGLGATFFTPLSNCPACDERLDIGPSFPASVAYYLKRTKARNKLNATFDYESELFVPVGDGEFVVVSNGDQSIVLPRPARFATKRDFYDFYQDYYHCAKPGPGEVQIIQPATVIRVSGGWKPQASGILEIVSDQPKKEALPLKREPVELTPQISTVAPAREKTATTLKADSESIECTDCGSLVETKYAFCWKCGHPTGERSLAGNRNLSSIPPVLEDEDQTAEHRVVSAGVPIFSWALPKEPVNSSTNGAVLKLIAVAVIGLVVMGLGLYVLVRWTSASAPATDAHAVEQGQSEAGSESGNINPNRESVEPSPPVSTPEEALRDLRSRSITDSDSSAAQAALEFLAPVEKQHVRDYRLPLERARLLVKAQSERFETEAFAALFIAAEKAINSGKAQEMLNSLHRHRTGDFRMLSRGHTEWRQLVRALRGKNARLLNATV